MTPPVAIDTHAHLADEKFDADRDEVLKRAWDAGLSVVVEIGEEESQWPKARALAEAHPGRVYWTAGYHPYYAVQADDGLPDRLAAELRHPACVAVGEIGLDYHRPDSPPEVQRRVLEKLLDVAARAGKPVVLHCRDAAAPSAAAEADLLEILRRRPDRLSDGGPAGVAHCFQGSASAAWELLRQGFLIGVDGPLTYPNASPLRALIGHLPLESLVLETDSPYLPPQSHRGKRNEPALLPAVVRALAELKHVAVEKIAAATAANARRLYRLPPL